LDVSIDAGFAAASSGEFPDGRRYSVTGLSQLESRKLVTRVRLKLDDGQTVSVDRIGGGLSEVARNKRSSELAGSARSRQAKIGRLSVGTGRIKECAEFYSRALGDIIMVQDGRLQITDWFELFEIERGAGAYLSELQITLVTSNLDKISKVLAGDTLGDGPTRRLRLRDPDGRIVYLEQED